MRSRTRRRSPPPRARASDAASCRRGRARGGAPRPRRSPAPARTYRRAARCARCAPAGTRAGSPPRRTRGSRRDPVAATRAIGTSCAGASRAHDDEPAAFVQHLAVLELGGELFTGEDALEDRPARAVVEDAVLVALEQ